MDFTICYGLQEAEDHCSARPCVEGSCLNTPGGYYCRCPAGRSGRHCELVPPCKSPNCHNGKCFCIVYTQTIGDVKCVLL